VSRGATSASLGACLGACLAIAGCGEARLDAVVAEDASGASAYDASFDAVFDAVFDVSADVRGDAGFCAGGGPLVRLPGDTCTGDVSAKLFRFAICACTTLSASGKLTTESFTATGAPSGGDGASIGANESIGTNSVLAIGGSVWAHGAGVTAPSPAVDVAIGGTIGRDVRSGGALRASGNFGVAGDLFVAGDATCTSGQIHATGALHAPASANVSGVVADKGRVTEAVSVTAPCNCVAPLPIATIVESVATANDDAAAGLAPAALVHAPAPLTLPCGRYYFTGIAGPTTLHLTGRTAIFVGGDVDVTGDLTIDLAPAAELDLFVAGNFRLIGAVSFGSTKAPSRLRVYIGGTAVDLSGPATIGANVYAPNADVAWSSALDMAGSLFTHRLAFSGDAHVRYDETVLETSGCAAPPASCKTCDDCGGATPACKGGACTACAADDDCCPPLRCQAGRCVASLR
jgi:hypothetical protein